MTAQTLSKKETATDIPGHVRAMELDDIDGVLEIENEAFVAPWSRRLFEETVLSPISKGLVVEQDGAVFAYIIFYAVDVEAHIMNLAVRGELRRRGHARQLLNHVLPLFKEGEISECYLEVRESNRGAQKLYKSFGFEMIGKRKRYYTETGEDAVVMQLLLQ